MHSETNKLDLDVEPWNAVNDGVMGGVSEGQIMATDDGLRFHGVLSLENNGGFASARRSVEKDLNDLNHIKLHVQGDGRRYQLRLRLDNNRDGVAWRQEFATSGVWQHVHFPLEDFVPVFRGQTLTGCEPLDPAQIGQLGFLLADGHPGEFQLDIGEIEFLPTAATA